LFLVLATPRNYQDQIPSSDLWGIYTRLQEIDFANLKALKLNLRNWDLETELKLIVLS
jgi:hypothetical protein